MALSNKERIGRLLDGVADGLYPVIEQLFAKAYGATWVTAVESQKGNDLGSSNPHDPQFLLNAAWFHWNETIGKTLGPAEKNYIAELRLTRNRWAHGSDKPFSGDDVYRAYDTAERLLRSVASSKADEIGKAKATILLENAVAAANERKKATVVAPTKAEPLQGLQPWRAIATPHADVAAGRYRQAEFAADLAQVARGEGSPEYVNPHEFFARTYLTEGLRLLLTGALRRLANQGGESVIDLQTTFGGGKTHSMLALWHLADPKVSVASLPGVERVMSDAAVASLPTVRRVAIVGTVLSPITPRVVEGHEIRTLWGEVARQLGGAQAYMQVENADREGVPPGSAVLRSLLAEHAPVVLLIDEWVTYARLQWGKDGLPGGSFDSALTFAQQLTQAVDQTPGALLVASLPSSTIEVGGEGGQKALEALQHVLHRMDAPWRPAAAQESFEIVRRRLFEPISADGAKARDEVIQRFGELYAQHSGVFPAHAKEKAYLDRIRACYPIHPELFDRLFDDWSTLEHFQRTRGVLKLMAAVAHELWERGDPNLLIMPASVPLDDTTVLPQFVYYLGDRWEAIVQSDIDGETSLPLRIDRENAGTYGRYSAARRVARTVFLGSAPVPAAANRGVDDRRILLGSVQPGEAPATFGDALRKLAGQATYLYESSGRYWYATQPSINQLARDRAGALKADRIEMDIERRLKIALADRGGFARVHPSPRTGADIPDEDEVGLVALGPEHPHDGKGAGSTSPAAQVARELLASRGAGTRVNQNMLVFLVPDATRLSELVQAVREYLAWSSILEDSEAERLDLDLAQKAQAKSQRDRADDAARARVPETYQWVLVPEQAGAMEPVELRQVKVSGPDALAVRAAKKLQNEDLLGTKFGGANLALLLRSGELSTLWSEQRAVELKKLWSWFAQYPYLPRLRDRSVLEAAVEDGASDLFWRSQTFAYAAARESDGEYRGIVAGEARPTPITASSWIVDGGMLPDPLPGTPTTAPTPDPTPEPHERPEPRTRGFHGEVALADPRRPIPELTRIVDEIIDRLAQQTDVSLKVSLTIEAEHRSAEGFSQDSIRTISENAKTLRFRDFRWEKE